MHLDRPFVGPVNVTQPFGPTENSFEPLGYQYPDQHVGFTEPYRGRVHTGVDYALDCGTPLLSPADGTVVYAGWDTSGYGYCVKIDHGTVTTLYGHLSHIGCKVGDRLAKGQRLGLSGTSGNSTGCHLHWSVISNKSGLYLPPSDFVFAKG